MHKRSILSLALAAALTVGTMVPALATDQVHVTDAN